MNFDHFGFKVLAYVGLGLGVVANIAQPYALLDGAAYQRTGRPERGFSIAGRFDAASTAQLRRYRSAMYDAVKRDAVTIDQPMLLKYQACDGETPIGDELDIVCNYAGGLEANTNNLYGETVPISFTMFLPLVHGSGDDGVALTVQQSVTNANYILQRTSTGQWQALGTGGSGVGGLTRDLIYGPNGYLYAAGSGITWGGVANAEPVAYWDGTAWNAMGTGEPASTAYTVAVGPDGGIYTGGNFATIGGVANTSAIARWSGTAWSALGTGVAGGSVYSIAVGPDGKVYAAGTFTSAGGVANTNGIAYWDPSDSAWHAMGTGLAGGAADGNSVAVAPTGYVYVVGAFTSAGGVSAANAAYWNGSAWSAMGSGLGSTGLSVDIGDDGTVYATGNFTTAGGITANYIAKWNGTAWASMGTGLNNTGYRVKVASNGLLYVGGDFTTAGGITLTDRYAVWNGSAWIYIDADMPGTITPQAFAFANDGALTVGYDTTGTATTAAITTATNDGSATTYPRLTIKGPTSGTSRIYQIYNYTTNKAVYLNYTINTGETAIFDFNPTTISFTSDFQGNIMNTVLPGSQQAEMFLTPGNNSVSFFAASSTVTASLAWQPTYNSVDDAIYGN